MNNISYFTQSNQNNNPDTSRNDSVPMSTPEKLVRDDVKKLAENAEEIRKLKEQLDKDKQKGEKK